MKRLRLALKSKDDSQEAVVERELTVGIADFAHGCGVRWAVAERRLFSSVHIFEDTVELWETIVSKPRLTRENPFLHDRQLRNLDERGLIREGTRVKVQDVLASILEADTALRTRRRPGKGMQWVQDRSWRVPSGWKDATVESIKRFSRRELGRHAPRGLWERIAVVLRAERPLEVGDVLSIGDQPVTVSCFLESNLPVDSEGRTADLVVPRNIAEQLGVSPERFLKLAIAKVDDRAANALQSRDVGPYSLITQIPSAKPPRPGQPINLAQVAWLRNHGLNELLSEFVSFKSDDLAHRHEIAELINMASGGTVNETSPAAPESLSSLRAWLIALGLNVTLSSEKDHVCIAVRPASPDQLRAESGGQVIRPETVDYRTWEDIDDGLFAPNVFGPSDETRRRRYGHIELAAPIVPMLWRTGEPSVLSQVLGISADEVESVIDHKSDVVWRDDDFHLQARSDAGGGESEAPDRLGTGAVAIRQLASRISVDQLPGCLRSCAEWLTTTVLVVIPPDLRPLVLLDSGNFATHDVNDLYRRVVSTNNRLRKLLDLKAPSAIIDKDQRRLQEAVDAVQANMLLPDGNAVCREGQTARLNCALSMVLSSANLTRKTVDWSGQARVIADESVAPNRVLVPRGMYQMLRLDDDAPLLLTCPHGDGRFAACFPQPHDQLAVRVAPQIFAELCRDNAQAAVVHVHRPVTTLGREEARRLMFGEALAQPGVMKSKSWIDQETPAEKLASLVAAVTSGDPQPLDSPRGLLIGGAGSTAILDNSAGKMITDNRREVPIPVEEQPRRSKPTFEQLTELANGYRRKACVFEVGPADEPPSVERGRIGGQPYLPAGIAWPTLHGKPLPFLGQFPLDAAREAKFLPMTVPENSLMTVFGGDDCWEPGPCGVRCPVFIHAIEDLSLRPLPEQLNRQGPLCAITPRIVEELPDWEEMREILDWELDRPEPRILQAFHEQVWPKLPSAAHAIKIGGWPAWIQTADSSQPLLLQLATNDKAEIMFGDSGTLYFFLEANRQFSCFSQCY